MTATPCGKYFAAAAEHHPLKPLYHTVFLDLSNIRAERESDGPYIAGRS
jgi:hypothetical protein